IRIRRDASLPKSSAVRIRSSQIAPAQDLAKPQSATAIREHGEACESWREVRPRWELLLRAGRRKARIQTCRPLPGPVPQILRDEFCPFAASTHLQVRAQ